MHQHSPMCICLYVRPFVSLLATTGSQLRPFFYLATLAVIYFKIIFIQKKKFAEAKHLSGGCGGGSSSGVVDGREEKYVLQNHSGKSENI